MTTPISYKQYLKAVGRKPIPTYDRLRSSRSPGDIEMPATGKPWWPTQSQGSAK
jgi:hypothetical protein